MRRFWTKDIDMWAFDKHHICVLLYLSVNKTFNKLPIEPYEMKQHFGSSNHINKALSYKKKESYQLKGLKKIKWC